jgi:hypothetical protein
MFGKKSKRNAIWMVGNSQAINVGSVNNSIVSIAINVEEGVPGSRESGLYVTLKNEGDKQVKALMLAMTAPAGIQIVNPGDLFGGGHRTHVTDSLAPRQTMRFKLGLRAHEEFRNGTLQLKLTDKDENSESAYTHFGVEVALHAYRR